MSDDNIALSSNDTETLFLELDDLYTEIEKSLFDMRNLLTNFSSVLEGEVSDEIIHKCSEFEDEFPVIGDNLKSYVQDFKNLVTSFERKNQTVRTKDVAMNKGGGDIINVKV